MGYPDQVAQEQVSTLELQKRVSKGNVLVALASLVQVLDHVLLLQLPHSLDLVEVDHEAGVVRVVQLDALATKNSEVVRAVEVLNSIRVLLAQLFAEVFFIFLIEVEIGLSKDLVFLNNLVEDVDV